MAEAHPQEKFVDEMQILLAALDNICMGYPVAETASGVGYDFILKHLPCGFGRFEAVSDREKTRLQSRITLFCNDSGCRVWGHGNSDITYLRAVACDRGGVQYGEVIIRRQEFGICVYFRCALPANKTLKHG